MHDFLTVTCKVYGTDEACCTGIYNDPARCVRQQFCLAAAPLCPDAYGFPYNDKTSLHTLRNTRVTDWAISFCPGVQSTMKFRPNEEQFEKPAKFDPSLVDNTRWLRKGGSRGTKFAPKGNFPKYNKFGGMYHNGTMPMVNTGTMYHNGTVPMVNTGKVYFNETVPRVNTGRVYFNETMPKLY